MKFVPCNTRKEFLAAAGDDWYKVIKVEGGYLGFTTMVDYKTWRNQL